MTFTTFDSFAEWCKGVQGYDVVEYKEHEKKIIIGGLWSTPGMIVCELLVSAYDSGFHFGPMMEGEYDGCIVIYED